MDSPPGTRSSGEALGIFAKAPGAGRVKTRLCPPLTPEEAAGLYRTALEETVAVMSGAALEPVLFYTGDSGFFRRAFPKHRLVPQGEGDLGRRQARALERLLAAGAPKAALIGSDSPDLPVSLVEKTWAALDEVDVATVPARDGGYVLIALRLPCPELFAAVPWSSAEVLATIRRRAAALGLQYREVGRWADVDDLNSLQRLIARSPASATSRYALDHLPHRL